MARSDIAVIGAGPAGLLAAIELARTGHKVVLVEKENRAGKKILVTGNGRCNLSNSTLVWKSNNKESKNHSKEAPLLPNEHYNNPQFVLPALREFDYSKVKEYFENLGLEVFEDSEGRVFPITNSANSVLSVLINECKRLNIEIVTEFLAEKIIEEEEHIELISTEQKKIEAQRVILSVGGTTEILKKLHVKLIGPKYVLGPLRTNTSTIKGLSGKRARCVLVIENNKGEKKAKEEGELLFRDYGISGIVVFNLSRFSEVGDKILIDFLPSFPLNTLTEKIERRMFDFEESIDSKTLLDGMLDPKVSQAIRKSFGITKKSTAKELSFAIKNFGLTVEGLPDKKTAQVMRGGIAEEEVNAETFELIKHPGVYAIGEVLDVDGPSGGFNLHWAWACALKCAKEM